MTAAWIFVFYAYFAVWYDISDQSRYPSGGPASGVIDVIEQLIILNMDAITVLKEGFLEADYCRTFLPYK